MDLEKLRQNFPDLTLLGGLSSWTVSQGTVVDVRREILSALQVAKEYSGVILGLSNYFQPETPIDNVVALFEIIEEHR